MRVRAADGCSMRSILYGDEAITFVPVVGALTTAGAGQVLDEGGYAHKAIREAVTLPEVASLSGLVNPDCGCMQDVFLEADVQVCMRLNVL